MTRAPWILIFAVLIVTTFAIGKSCGVAETIQRTYPDPMTETPLQRKLKGLRQPIRIIVLEGGMSERAMADESLDGTPDGYEFVMVTTIEKVWCAVYQSKEKE